MSGNDREPMDDRPETKTAQLRLGEPTACPDGAPLSRGGSGECEGDFFHRPHLDGACDKQRRNWVLAASVLGSSMAFIDGTAVTLALKPLQDGLNATLGEVLWVVNAYTLFLAALVLIGGSLGDLFGRRLIFVSGIVVFSVSSLICAAAPDATILIIGRALQGVGAALLTPVSLALVSAAFPKEERGRAIGTWTAASAIMTAIGPPLGGWLAEAASWRWIFLLNAPIGVVAIGLTLWKTPPSCAPGKIKSIDWQGAVLAVFGLGAVAYGLIGWAEDRISSMIWGASIGAGLLLLALFVFVERRTPQPMAPPSLFQSREFTVINVMTLFLYGALGGVFVFFPFTLAEAFDHSTFNVALAFLPFVAAMGVLARFTGALGDAYGLRAPLTIGPLLACVAFLIMGLTTINGSLLYGAAPAMAIFGIGMAITVPALSTAVFNTAPEDQAGAASGVNNAVARVAGLLALAGFGVIAAGGFRRAAAGAPELANPQFGAAPDLTAPGGEIAYEIYQSAIAAGFRSVLTGAILLAVISAAVSYLFLKPALTGRDAD